MTAPRDVFCRRLVQIEPVTRLLLQAPNNVVRYEITADLEDRECFLLNEITGDLLLRRSLLYDPCRATSFNVSRSGLSVDLMPLSCATRHRQQAWTICIL